MKKSFYIQTETFFVERKKIFYLLDLIYMKSNVIEIKRTGSILAEKNHEFSSRHLFFNMLGESCLLFEVFDKTLNSLQNGQSKICA